MLHTRLYFLFVFVFPKMEAPNFVSIFECISDGVNKVLVLVHRRSRHHNHRRYRHLSHDADDDDDDHHHHHHHRRHHHHHRSSRRPGKR